MLAFLMDAYGCCSLISTSTPITTSTLKPTTIATTQQITSERPITTTPKPNYDFNCTNDGQDDLSNLACSLKNGTINNANVTDIARNATQAYIVSNSDTDSIVKVTTILYNITTDVKNLSTTDFVSISNLTDIILDTDVSKLKQSDQFTIDDTGQTTTQL